MTLFLLGLVVLLLGYWGYGKVVERILQPDDRKTPALALEDGVDFVTLPYWKNMLIQLLNIAGIGPVIGVISGIKFGTIAFVIIPVGCVLMGAVHDFVAGMMSLRNEGANLPKLVKKYLTKPVGGVFDVFMNVTLMLVVAVFINVPATLISKLAPFQHCFLIALLLIFFYYLLATMFPIDKIIGKVYPVFGGVLLLGTLALFFCLLVKGFAQPEILQESEGFRQNMFTAAKNQPIIPLLFVTIACGILSGFHATQAPLVARTMKTERQAKNTFFGMMIVEGFIAMVWAAGALVIYNHAPELMKTNPNGVLLKITDFFFHFRCTSIIVVVSVIILAVTSGDTALRSARIAVADALKLEQHTIWKRFLVCVPMIVIVAILLFWSNKSASSFGILWNYFAWANQVMAAFTLAAGTVYLIAEKKPCFITLLPGLFITMIEGTYIFWISPAHGGPVGFGLPLEQALLFGGFFSFLIFAIVYQRGKALQRDTVAK